MHVSELETTVRARFGRFLGTEGRAAAGRMVQPRGTYQKKTEGIEEVCLTARALAHIHMVPYNQR